MADAPVTPKTTYIVHAWLRNDHNATANCRVTRCVPSIIGSTPVQHTDNEGKKHCFWTAVKDGMAFDFVSDDVIDPAYRGVEQWCRAKDTQPEVRQRILGVMSSVDQMVAVRNNLGKDFQFDWGESKKGTIHGYLQRLRDGQVTELVMTYKIMRR